MTKKVKMVLSLLLCFALMVTSINFPLLQVNASAATATPISSITYEFTIEGVDDESSLKFTAQTSGWESLERIISLDGDGDYTVTVNPTWSSEVSGLKNLGFVETITNSAITMTVNKIIINGSYELTYDTEKVLYVNSDWQNCLAHVTWEPVAGEFICGNSTAYLAVNDAADAIVFFTATDDEDTQPDDIIDKLTVINSIQYDFSITKTNGETSLAFTSQTVSWNNYDDDIMLSGDGNYSLTLHPGADGFTNLGYFTYIPGSQIEAELTKITINDTYEMTFLQNPVAYVGTDSSNGFWNIWWQGIEDDTKLCSGDNCFISFYYNNRISFYIQTEQSDWPGMSTDRSQDYVYAMGSGWNLGNSLDAVFTDEAMPDDREETWGNPVVTREFIAAVKDKGFDSIRIPYTICRRYTVNPTAGIGEYKYVIDPDWLARYKEIVDWAVDEGLYVMINIHHDSWAWLSEWDGNVSSEEYIMFTEFWQQLSECFADQPDSVCFETINEPDFEPTGAISAQSKLDMINLAAYDIIRGTAGNEDRMIILPTLITNHEKGEPLFDLIAGLDDENIIATVHYYSEWVYSANLGKTGFDEELWQDNGSYTARVAADRMMETVYNQFGSKGIGVVIGEYGLLGYDSSDGCLQTGEELKYYEYMNELARQNGICLMFWDNGSGINRTDTNSYSWKSPLVGSMLEASMSGRSSYATGLDSIYIAEEVTEDIAIPLTLNGNTFTGIEGLTEGVDYTYDYAEEAVIIKKEFINDNFNAMGNSYGVFASMILTFSQGADWTEYLIKYSTPVFSNAAGTTGGISIPVSFKGSKIRRITAYQNENRVGPHSDWWPYLQYGEPYKVDYTNNLLIFTSTFFQDSSVNDGIIKAVIECYDGQIVNAWMNVNGTVVTSNPSLSGDIDDDDEPENNSGNDTSAGSSNTANEVTIDVQVGENVPDALFNDSIKDLVNNVFTAAELAQIAAGASANIYLTLEDISATIDSNEKNLIQDELTNPDLTGFYLGQYLDISLFKKIGNSKETKITDTKGEISISIMIPDSLKSNNITKKRNYKIIRIHNGVSAIINGTFNEAAGLFTFMTDAFSTYVLVYEEVPAYYYDDVPGHIYENELRHIIDNGIMSNNGRLIFPDNALTKGAASLSLNSLLGITKGYAGMNSVKNLKKGAQYYTTVSRGIQAGYLVLKPDNTVYSPLAKATYGYLADIYSSVLGEDMRALILEGHKRSDTLTRGEYAALITKIAPMVISENTSNLTVDGNVYVTTPQDLNSKIVLTNMTINGDLIIADGMSATKKRVVLVNTTVTGKVIIRGGSEDTLQLMHNSSTGEISILK